MTQNILVTGAAGFIGMHTAEALLARGEQVVGVDNVNDYYDVALKEARLQRLQAYPNFTLVRADCADTQAMKSLFSAHTFTHIVHLAAQAGVRYSYENPSAYAHSNLMGFHEILMGAVAQKVQHFVYASTSSAYGLNQKQPYSEAEGANHPLSYYAASKRANELMAHAISHLHRLPCTGLRFFTVYGPWGRPDMALMRFTRAILQGTPIDLYHRGQMYRDFTYIDDIKAALLRVLDKPATAAANFDRNHPDPAQSTAPYRVFNIGRQEQRVLTDYVSVLEKVLGKTAIINHLPMQAGDVESTYADVSRLQDWVDYRPRVSIETGVAEFVDWYRSFYLQNV